MKTQSQSRPSTTPMVVTGAWLTAIIRGGTVATASGSPPGRSGG